MSELAEREARFLVVETVGGIPPHSSRRRRLPVVVLPPHPAGRVERKGKKQVVEAKVAAVQSAGNPAKAAEPVYEKGGKEIVLTERELNGLLNENTSLGKSLSFQLGTDVVLARVETVLDPDLPLLGGKTLKARARFYVSQSAGKPSFVIDDITIWGISLPNAWLGGNQESQSARGDTRLDAGWPAPGRGVVLHHARRTPHQTRRLERFKKSGL